MLAQLLRLQFVRFLVAGGVAVAVNLGALYAFTEFLGVYYLVSAVCAFFVSFSVSFVLQKFWTFGERTHERAHAQAAAYLVLQLTALVLNTTLLYLFVTYLHFWYIFAQAVISLGIACVVFFINKLIIFKRTDIVV